MKKNIFFIIIVALNIILITLIISILLQYNVIPQKIFYAEDFGIESVKSDVDFNENGVDDYTDIMLGARIDAENKPKYNGAYYQGGYPPENIGVCTDLIWRAFKNAGYSLKDMVDKDVLARPKAYTRIEKPDTNIDFRRVGNLRVFFEEHAISLTLDINKIEEFQAGDIVIFGQDDHIGIVSDKRNKKGMPYIIHNGAQLNREEDYFKRVLPSGHYRFDASLVGKEMLEKWD